MSYVYLMTDGKAHKIGVAKDTQKRLATIQTGNANMITVVHCVKSNDPYWLESELHKLFSHKLILGEWFDLSQAEVAQTILEMDSHGEAVSTLAMVDYQSRIKPKIGRGVVVDLPWWMKERNVKWERAGAGWTKWRLTYSNSGKTQTRHYVGWMSGAMLAKVMEVFV